MEQHSGEVELIFERRFLSFGFFELERAEAQIHGFAEFGSYAVGNQMWNIVIDARYSNCELSDMIPQEYGRYEKNHESEVLSQHDLNRRTSVSQRSSTLSESEK